MDTTLNHLSGGSSLDDVRLKEDAASSPTQNQNVKQVSRSNPASYLSSSIVTIIVSASGKQYRAHKDLLTTYSPFFEACLNSAFSEATSLKVKLEDENASVVEMFLHWLYTGDLEGMDGRSTPSLVAAIIPLYKLADKWLVLELKNELVDHERREYRQRNRLPDPDCLTAINANDLLDSQLAKFLLRLTAWALIGHPTWYSKTGRSEDSRKRYASLQRLYMDKEASTVLLQYAVDYADKKWSDPRAETGCVYHEHDNVTNCPVQNQDKSLERKRQLTTLVADDMANHALNAYELPMEGTASVPLLDNSLVPPETQRSENRLSRMTLMFSRGKKRST